MIHELKPSLLDEMDIHFAENFIAAQIARGGDDEFMARMAMELTDSPAISQMDAVVALIGLSAKREGKQSWKAIVAFAICAGMEMMDQKWREHQ
jgi:hypothetical protein